MEDITPFTGGVWPYSLYRGGSWADFGRGSSFLFFFSYLLLIFLGFFFCLWYCGWWASQPVCGPHQIAGDLTLTAQPDTPSVHAFCLHRGKMSLVTWLYKNSGPVEGVFIAVVTWVQDMPICVLAYIRVMRRCARAGGEYIWHEVWLRVRCLCYSIKFPPDTAPQHGHSNWFPWWHPAPTNELIQRQWK